jgi:hypothetical protein
VAANAAQEAIKLSADQETAVATVQKEVDSRLDALLNDDQKNMLKEIRQMAARAGRPGGPGGQPTAPAAREDRTSVRRGVAKEIPSFAPTATARITRLTPPAHPEPSIADPEPLITGRG